mmetsp:Transcript_22050/g.54534  ORF Transcript_22050/g.54534 Transcript_22050/m.54534 type:complete len:296 (+) Transcript_22050:1223-2110(+)
MLPDFLCTGLPRAQPLICLARQQLLHDLLALGTRVHVLGPLQGLRHDVLQRLVKVRALEGRAAGNHLVEEDAKGPPVDGVRLAGATDDFRCDVLLGSDKGVGLCGQDVVVLLDDVEFREIGLGGHAPVEQGLQGKPLVTLGDGWLEHLSLLGQIEVGEGDVPGAAHQNVFWFEVAVNEPEVVEVLEREQDLRGVETRGVFLKPPLRLALEHAEKLAAGAVLHDKAQPALGLERRVHGGDEGVVRRREDLALGHDAFDLILRNHFLLGEHLHSVDLVGAFQKNQVDLPDAAAAQQL